MLVFYDDDIKRTFELVNFIHFYEIPVLVPISIYVYVKCYSMVKMEKGVLLWVQFKQT
jgi:hypothetical protein